MPDEALQPPIEIPWKLASTTQPLRSGGPDETTISLFFHEPDEETLVAVSPDEKLVYFKVTASISPCRLESIDSELASAFLAGNLPVLHLQLDLEISPGSGETGGIRPYFHGAQPLHRRFVETGVVGNNIVEGAADSQFFGKSGSQLHESVESSARTTTAGASGLFTLPLVPAILGASVQTTGTDISSSRSVDQVVDTTTREAAQERRELVSHTTNVENVLTLLSAKYVGTPYLRFSLFPRPLQLLSVDPADPNLWFSQLLRQRSSGIEGIQEFTAVARVPRDADFCVEAKLRRVCLLDDPPKPFRLDETLRPDFIQLLRMAAYLTELFPVGTPLDELDIDVVSHLPAEPELPRPVVRTFAARPGPNVFEILALSPSDVPGLARGANVNYKHMLEVWLETLRYEHQKELERSPLERGAVLGENRRLDTCFTPGDGALVVGETARSVTPLVPVDFRFPRDRVIGDEVLANDVRGRALQTITHWNAVEAELNRTLSNLDDIPEEGEVLDDERVVDVLISRWAKMPPDDPRNVDLEQAAAALGLGNDLKAKLAKAGVQDLRDAANALRAAPGVEAHNEDVERLKEEIGAADCDATTRRLFAVTLPDRIDSALSGSDAEALRSSIDESLRGGYDKPAPKKKKTKKKASAKKKRHK